MVKLSTLRASDEDREQVAERLRKAATEGRLLAEEFEQRLASALRARTYGELDLLVADLPSGRGHAAVQRRPRMPPVATVAAAAVLAVVVMAVTAAALLILVSLYSFWLVWAVAVWWFVARRRRGAGRCGGRAQMHVAHRRSLL